MTPSTHTMWTTQQTRRRAMVVPREHGAWGLLLVPLFTGVVAGFAPEHRVWALLQLTLITLSLFCCGHHSRACWARVRLWHAHQTSVGQRSSLLLGRDSCPP